MSFPVFFVVVCSWSTTGNLRGQYASVGLTQACPKYKHWVIGVGRTLASRPLFEKYDTCQLCSWITIEHLYIQYRVIHYTDMYMQICTRACTHTHICIIIYTHWCTHIDTHTNTHIYKLTHIHILTHIHTHTHTCTHTHTHRQTPTGGWTRSRVLFICIVISIHFYKCKQRA